MEIDPFCRAVLAKHWPAVRRYEDVRTVGAELERVDVICGGFPCQPVSVAGARRGQADDRWLWPEFARVVRQLRPRYVVVENVPGLFTAGFDDVLGDLAACGFDAEWDCLPASAFGANHRRDRIWIVAYAGHASGRAHVAQHRVSGSISVRRERCEAHDFFRERGEDVADTSSAGLESAEQASIFTAWRREERRAITECGWWDVEPDVGRVAHGVPARVDRLRGLGNAIVPQIAQFIAERIKAAEEISSSEAPKDGGGG